MRQRRSPAKTVGAEVPGEFDSRTIRQPICSDRPRDRAWNPAGRKRVGSAWRNAVGHTCPMRSRAFLLGVTAAHGSLEPLVLVRIQEEELGGSTSNRFSLYTRFDVCCTGHTGGQASPKPRKRRHALVAQWIERPPPERKATSPILVEGTHENSANHNARSPSSLLSHAVAPRTGSCITRQRPCSSTDRAPVS